MVWYYCVLAGRPHQSFSITFDVRPRAMTLPRAFDLSSCLYAPWQSRYRKTLYRDMKIWSLWHPSKVGNIDEKVSDVRCWLYCRILGIYTNSHEFTHIHRLPHLILNTLPLSTLWERRLESCVFNCFIIYWWFLIETTLAVCHEKFWNKIEKVLRRRVRPWFNSTNQTLSRRMETKMISEHRVLTRANHPICM